jgi:translation initiation factor 2B subunit (eIF-2B alpha/beta/delta family)
MGAVWNLAAAALDDGDLFDRLVRRAARSAASAARHAAHLLREDTRRVITCSRSAAVEACIRALACPTVCAESRPALEGRALAEGLARDGLSVTVVSDAAIASGLAPGDVVLVGADAIAADWFINKTGTGQLCAAALVAGVPAYVVSGREKCVPRSMAPELSLRADDPASIWPDPPRGVRVESTLFERVPIDRVAGVITDAGLLAGGMIAAACEGVVPAPAARAFLDLLKEE